LRPSSNHSQSELLFSSPADSRYASTGVGLVGGSLGDGKNTKRHLLLHPFDPATLPSRCLPSRLSSTYEAFTLATSRPVEGKFTTPSLPGHRGVFNTPNVDFLHPPSLMADLIAGPGRKDVRRTKCFHARTNLFGFLAPVPHLIFSAGDTSRFSKITRITFTQFCALGRFVSLLSPPLTQMKVLARPVRRIMLDEIRATPMVFPNLSSCGLRTFS